MKQCLIVFLCTLYMTSVPGASQAGFFDDLTEKLGVSTGQDSGLDDTTIAGGLKEALSTGTANAVKAVSSPDGYLGNEMIKILVPEKIRGVVDLVGRAGFQGQVDDFILTMNRAAEKAAPQATKHFVSALKAMTFEDANKILKGSNTAATEYFKQKTGGNIFDSFLPVISSSMKETGVDKAYSKLTDKVAAVPFAGSMDPLDMDRYVTTKAVDGLFLMIGEEEKKIRTNPAARGTDLLRKVFGK